MTTPPFFPDIRGQGFPTRSPIWKGTRVEQATSGRRVAIQNWSAPLYAWDIPFELLCDGDLNSGATPHSRQMILDLFNQCGGQFGTFIYVDPTDTQCLGEPLGIGDGTTTTFAFQRELFNYVEPVSWVLSVDAVYFDNVAQDATFGGAVWNLSQPNSLVFAVAPTSGVVISADFNFAFVCQFTMDTIDIKQFAFGMHSCDSVKFQSVRTS